MEFTTATDQSSDRGVVAKQRLELRNDKDDLLHLVCCRDPEWKVAFCGYEADVINVTGESVCTMCIEVARRRDPEFGTRAAATCPIDLSPCPDEHEVDLRILREVSP